MESLNLHNLPYIADLQKGLLDEGFFLLKKIHMTIGRSKKPFLRMLLSDKSGHLPAVYFGSEKELNGILHDLEEGDIVKVKGILEEFQNVWQIKLLNIEKDTRKDKTVSRFWKRTPHDRRKLYREMKQLILAIESGVLKNICLDFLKDREFMKLFLEAPASRFTHHAYIGGLLEHTLRVMQILKSFAEIYRHADRDLMLAGGFLRKTGKVDEYRYLVYGIDHSLVGKLKGHTLLSYDRLQMKMQNHEIEENLRLKLEHIVLSHQGRKNWGAVEEPRFLEAHLVHAADSADTHQFIFSEPRRRSSDSEEGGFVSVHGRDIYTG